MTPGDLQACHARAAVVSSRLRLPLRARVWRGQAGEFAGAGVGSSLDFQDHRAYSPGDDPRHINWQAYARTGAYTMKLYREEVRPVIDICLDVSGSMFFEPAKAARTAELLYFLTDSANRAGASAKVHLIRGSANSLLEAGAVASHRWFEQIEKLPAESAAAPPALDRLPVRARSIRVLISDLLFPGDPSPLIRDLARSQGSAVIFAPFLASEAAPDWQGNYEFVDTERASHHPHRIEPAVLRRYREAYANHFGFWKATARRFQASLARVPCEGPLEPALSLESLTTGALETSQ
jgi:uncharacterized protein (DUF58 family)